MEEAPQSLAARLSLAAGEAESLESRLAGAERHLSDAYAKLNDLNSVLKEQEAQRADYDNRLEEAFVRLDAAELDAESARRRMRLWATIAGCFFISAVCFLITNFLPR